MNTRTRKGKVKRQWMAQHLHDPYVKLAQKEGYRARAAYKLKEIDEAQHLISAGDCVVDLGAAPGAWCQYVQRKFALHPDRGGRIIALDLLPMEPLDGVTFIQGDFREDAVLEQLICALQGRTVDVVISDMAPNLSGIGVSDAARMSHLIELALDFASHHLKPEGALLAKLFHGSGYSQLVELFKASFQQVKAIKPKASRSKSAETYLLGRLLKK